MVTLYNILELIKINPNWTTKHKSKGEYNTHRNLFEPLQSNIFKGRAMKLRYEQTRGRKYNIISGASNEIKF